MKFINLLNEYSKNDPIPEIARYPKNLAIFIIGPPASGKSTFYKEYVHRLQPNIKMFDPDFVSYAYTKSWDKRRNGATELTHKSLMYYVKSGQNFAYVTTGGAPGSVTSKYIQHVHKLATIVGYHSIFIHLLSSKALGTKRNHDRIKKGENYADDMYLDVQYNNTQSLIKFYSKLDDVLNYYIVVSLNNKYQFFKYKNGQLYVKKGGQYVLLKK